MVKAVDFSKFRKDITKNIAGVSTGFKDPDTWVSTGNYCLNYLISGDFSKGIPLGKVTTFAGESGSGKSFIVSGSVAKHAQEQGIYVFMIDTENALDESWLKALGVDTSEDKLTKISASLVDDVSRTISDFVKYYKSEYLDKPEEERPKVLFIIDSLGMLMSPTEVSQFEKGEMKGDMGRKPKQLKSMVTNLVGMFGSLNIGLVATNHTYASQDMYDPDDKVSGGSGFVFASSILVLMKKKKLKEGDDGIKGTDVLGIKASCKIVKSRYNKPFETVDIYIPYATGMDPYSGLFDLFLKTGVLTKTGNRYKYTSKITGKEFTEFRKNITQEMWHIMMDEYTSDDFEIRPVLVDEDGEVENVD